MVTVVIPYRSSDNGSELRYALRSIAAHLDHDEVVVVGDSEPWLTGVREIPVRQSGTPAENRRRNLLATLCDPWVSDPFILMWDDVYVMTGPAGLPAMTRGPAAQVLPLLADDSYKAGIVATVNRLQAEGIMNPRLYDAIHVPQWVDKEGLRATIEGGWPALLTAYGNLNPRPPEWEVPNAKNPPDYAHRAYLSSNTTSWRGPLGAYVRGVFPDPCRYER